MTRRILQFAAVAALCLGVFVQQSSAAVTYRIEDATIFEGTSSGTFDIFVDVTAPDLGLFVSGFNISAGLGTGDLGGGAMGVTLGTPVQPTSNALIPNGPAVGPPGLPLTAPNAFRLTVVENPAMGGQPLANGKSLVTVPYSLAAPAVLGEMVTLVFNDPNSPFNNYTLADNTMLNVGSLFPGSITVTAVPEPGSTFALGAMFVACGVRRYRKKRKTA